MAEALTGEMEVLSLAKGAPMSVRRQYQSAIRYYTNVLARQPQNAKIYMERGKAYNKLSDYQAALPDFEHALALSPNLAEAYLGRAWANDQLDNFGAAESDYKKYLTMGQTRMTNFAAFCLADNAAQQGKTAEALKTLNALVLRQPKAGMPRRLRGTLLNSDNGNPKLAVEDFSVAIDQKIDEYRDIYPLRASAYTRLKDYPKAIADYTTMLKLSPNDDNAYRKRAAVYELMGDYQHAISDYSRGIWANLDGAGPFYFGRARCYKKLGQDKLAQKDMDECKRLDYTGK
jgi:tetratricopeptide (TPR) repeat protein